MLLFSKILYPFFPITKPISRVKKTIELKKERSIFASPVEETIRAMSFNIRCENGNAENPTWTCRKERVASMIRFHSADLVGLQEPHKAQLADLNKILCEFHLFGVELTDGSSVDEGLYDAILFRKNRFTLLEKGVFYLSPTPDVPSRGWEAKFIRGVIWAKLLDQKSGKALYFFNTHFDYHSRLARDKSVELLKEKIGEIAKDAPFVVVGDFNLFPELGGEETYRALTDSKSSIQLVDAQHVSQFPHHGPTGTWSGFKEAGQPGIKPDYIFVDPRVQVRLHGVLSDSFDGEFPSDHLPVVADIVLAAR